VPLEQLVTAYRTCLNDAALRTKIDATLLTDDQDLKKRIATHPGLHWKAVNVREHKGG